MSELPDHFNERFTVYLGADGKPAERSLRDMSVGEVIAAINWHQDEAARLARAAEPLIATAKIRRVDGGLPDGVTTVQLDGAVATMRGAGEAALKSARLLELVCTCIPAWGWHPGMTMGEAVRRFWTCT